jgi:hypothetical protein
MKDGDLNVGIEYPLFTGQAKPYRERYGRGLREVRNLFLEPLGLSLPLEVKANITTGRIMDSVIPYGSGYRFDIRDTTWNTRVEKITSLPKDDFLLQDFPDNPYTLEFLADEYTLGKLGFSREIPDHYPYSPNKVMKWHFKKPAREILERLRVKVTFAGENTENSFDLEENPPIVQPGGVYQARPDSFNLSNGAYITMSHFYPTEIGPLPLEGDSEQELADSINERFEADKDKTQINPDDITFWEGLYLRLPKNQKQLLAARMKFRIISEEEEKFES